MKKTFLLTGALVVLLLAVVVPLLFSEGAPSVHDEAPFSGRLYPPILSEWRLSSPYGWRDDPISGSRRYHAALDMAAPLNTPVYSTMPGRVLKIGHDETYGNYIIISHDNDYQSLYAHLNSVLVVEKQEVTREVKIALVGSTGYSIEPHLHFVVYKNDQAINPLSEIMRTITGSRQEILDN
jgi:murein DD-endopeptidase MepM/ murein hydrolase activator NlpD